MLTAQVPFQNLQNNQVKIAMAIQSGKRPTVPQSASRDLSRLIKHCWDDDSDRRPTFSQILETMASSYICFPDSDLRAVNEFYRKRNSAPPLIDDRRLALELVRRPTAELGPTLQRITNSAGMVASLRIPEFVTPAAALLSRPEYGEPVALILACVLDTPDLVNVFVSANGLSSLSAMLKIPENVRAAVALARRLVDSLALDKRQRLASDLAGAGAWDCALEFVDSFRVNPKAIVEPRIAQVVAATETSAKACELLMKCVDPATLPDDQITVRLAILAGNSELVDRVLRSGQFTSKLNDPAVIPIVADGLLRKNEFQECAVKIAKVFPPEGMAVAVRERIVLEQIVTINGDALSILARVASIKNGAEAILGNVDLLEKEIRNPLVFGIFINIAKDFAEDLLQIDWFVNEIARNFVEYENIADTLTLVCHLANSDLLFERGQILKRLTRLLKLGDCSVPEMHTLLRIYEKLAPNCSFTDIYGYLLQAAEAKTVYGGVGLRILTAQKMPIPKTKYSVRLLAAVSASLDDGDDERAKAAAELLAVMAKKTPYAREIADSAMKDLVLRTMLKTQSGDLFEILLMVVKLCGLKPSHEIMRTGDQFVRRIGKTQPDVAAGIASLLDEMR
jgi:hypothetical protein